MTLGDLNITQILLGYTYPPKILCAAFQRQYYKPNSLWTPKGIKQHSTNVLDEINENTLRCIKAVSQLNVYHFSQQHEDNDDNDTNNENNEI